ncbi:tetratricopeptide repeat protein [soil metagenome]
MKFNSVCIAFLIFCFGVSCKHGEKIAKKEDHFQFTDTHLGKDETPAMTAGKASEEETFVKGCIQKSLGNPGRALVEFQECLNMNPNSAVANYEIAGILSMQGQADRALKYAKAANDLSPENRWYKLRYAEILTSNNQFENATKIYKSLSDKEPENTDLLFRYASSLKNAGKNEEALKTYDRIENLEGISDTLQSSRIMVYRISGDKSGEENAMKALIKAFPDNIDFYYRLADFYEATGNAAAGNFYVEMLQKFPGEIGPLLKSAELQKKSSDGTEQSKAFATARTAFLIPSDPELKIKFLQDNYPITESSASLTSKEKTEADTLCSILRRTHPEIAAVYSVSGDYLFKENKMSAAREFYHKAAALGQDEYGPWKRLLEINAGLKDDIAQEKDCKQVMQLFPTQPESYFYLGIIQYNKKEYFKAIDNLETGRDFLIDNPGKDIEIKTILVDCYRSTGKIMKADDYSESIIAKDSSNIPLIVAYCQSMCDQKTNLYNVEQLMLYVIVKTPSVPAYYELLGWIEYEMGDYRVADQWMSKALSLTPENPRMNERLGDIEFHMGNKEMALAYWKKAKEKGAKSEELDNKIATKTMEEK